MLILRKTDVEKALNMAQAIEAVRSGFKEFCEGRVISPLRTTMKIPDKGSLSSMSVYLCKEETITLKVFSMFDNNHLRGLPLLHYIVVAFDGNTGEPVAIMEGESLTRLRTGAASGVATDLLSLPNARVAAIIGAGVQGRNQLEAVCAVRKIDKAWIYDTDIQKAQSFCDEMEIRLGIIINQASSVQEALCEADVICTATPAVSPVFLDEYVKPGAHINAIGAYKPHMQEIPEITIMRGRVYVDSREAGLAEAGDLLIPLNKGLINHEHIIGEIGELMVNPNLGRKTNEEITIFKSVGVAVQDGVVATAIVTEAKQKGLGLTVEL